MTVTVPVVPSRICAERGCRTVLSIWNPLDKCSLHVERHIMPTAGVYIRMTDGLPPLPNQNLANSFEPPVYGQCPTCGRICGKAGCRVCPAESYQEAM